MTSFRPRSEARQGGRQDKRPPSADGAQAVFRSHWGFAAEFCTPAAAHEKGGVEGDVGYFRRNHWVPVPQGRDLEGLNEQLLGACPQDQRRMIAGREACMGTAMRAEQGFAPAGAQPKPEPNPLFEETRAKARKHHRRGKSKRRDKTREELKSRT